jgi:hypothetical protein
MKMKMSNHVMKMTMSKIKRGTNLLVIHFIEQLLLPTISVLGKPAEKEQRDLENNSI